MADKSQEQNKNFDQFPDPVVSEQAATDTISSDKQRINADPEDISEQTKKGGPAFFNSAPIETALIVVCLVALFVLLRRDTGGDGWPRYQGLLEIVINHTFPTMKYSLVGPAFALPLVWLGHKLNNPFQVTIIYNQLLFAFTLLVSYLLLRKQVSRALLRKFYLVLIVASMFVAHLAFFYGEVFTALCVGFGILIVYLRFKAPVGWLVVGLGIANTPASLVALGLVLLKYVWDNKRLRVLAAFLIPLALIALVNWLEQGNPLSTPYMNDHGVKTIMPYSGLADFSYPFLFGLLSETLSFGKGLLFFAPGLLLPVRATLLRLQRDRQIPLYSVYLLWLIFVAGLVLIYARWWDWSGALFWGPRFLLFASIPASFAIAVRLQHYKQSSLVVNLLTLGIFIFSVWICLDGALYQWFRLPAVCSQNNYNLEMVCYYIPEFSVLWLPFRVYYALGKKELIFGTVIILTATYMLLPLCIHLLYQFREFYQKYSKTALSLKDWRL